MPGSHFHSAWSKLHIKGASCNGGRSTLSTSSFQGFSLPFRLQLKTTKMMEYWLVLELSCHIEAILQQPPCPKERFHGERKTPWRIAIRRWNNCTKSRFTPASANIVWRSSICYRNSIFFNPIISHVEFRASATFLARRGEMAPIHSARNPRINL